MNQARSEEFLPSQLGRQSAPNLQVIGLPTPRNDSDKSEGRLAELVAVVSETVAPTLDDVVASNEGRVGPLTTVPHIGRCMRSGCSNFLPPRRAGRAGRGRRYCTSECRTLAGRERKTDKRLARPEQERTRRPAAPLLKTRFGSLLDQAIRAAETTPEKISAEFKNQHQVSPGAMRSWIRGRVPRHRTGDRELVGALERRLDLQSGELWLLLQRDREDRRPRSVETIAPSTQPRTEEVEVEEIRSELRDRGASDDYATVRLEERFFIGRDRRQYRQVVRPTVRALNDKTDAYRLVFSPDDPQAKCQINPLWRCRRGREIRRPSGLTAVELLFDKGVLARGESFTFDYEELRLGGAPQNWVRRGVGHSAVEAITMTVQFATPPAHVYKCQWDQRGTHPISTTEIDMVDNTATNHLIKPAPGLWGLCWVW